MPVRTPMLIKFDATAMTIRGLLLALAFALALAGCGSKTPPLPSVGAGDVILAFGDSLTYGTGAAAEESYPQVLAQLIGREVVGAGVPGETTIGGLARLPDLLEELRPKIMLLCLGGNDMLRKVDPAVTERNLRAMIDMAKSRGVAVVLIGVPRPGLFSGNAPVYETLAGEYGLPFEDAILKDVLYDNEFKSDPIHPNAKGYRKMAEAVAGLLRDAGAL